MIDEITITLRDKYNNMHNIFVEVSHSSLSEKWLHSLNRLVKDGYHLEKNYHWMGFAERDLPILCDKINHSLQTIKEFNWENVGLPQYKITEYFTMENTLTPGPIGPNLPGGHVDHDMFNLLHRHFENLQGQAGRISEYYKNSDRKIRWHIRQLNLLCHEFESRALSYRKLKYAPEWQQYTQLFCFLNTPTFNLDPTTDFDAFGLDTLNRKLGDITLGIDKSVGKSHWEVFNDEGDVKLDETTTTALTSQWQGSGDFDIRWSRTDTAGTLPVIEQFSNWLKKNGLNPSDPSLTLGHPIIAKVNLLKSFHSEDSKIIQTIISNHLDVYKIKTSDAEATFDYRWSDKDYNNLQISLLH